MKIYRLRFKDYRVLFVNEPIIMEHVDAFDGYFHTKRELKRAYRKYVDIINEYGKNKSFLKDGYTYSQGVQFYYISNNYKEPDMKVWYDVLNTID